MWKIEEREQSLRGRGWKIPIDGREGRKCIIHSIFKTLSKIANMWKMYCAIKFYIYKEDAQNICVRDDMNSRNSIDP